MVFFEVDGSDSLYVCIVSCVLFSKVNFVL